MRFSAENKKNIINIVVFSEDMRTLIVEDVHFLALILQRILEPYSKCDFAHDGSIAIEKYTRSVINSNPYDLICLDLLLPKTDGFEVLKSVRQFEDDFKVPPNERTRIVVISTFNDQKTVRRAHAAGCDGYIAKPFRKDKVLRTIEKLGLVKYSQPDDEFDGDE